MALTMGRFYGIFPAGVGSFDNGVFSVSMSFEGIIPAATQSEQITSLASLANVEMPLAVKMQLVGVNADEIALISKAS